MSVLVDAADHDRDFEGGRGSSDEDLVENSFSEEDDDWKPEYDDWEGERKDFTKKLNAARNEHSWGCNVRHQRNDSSSTSKSLHVSNL